MFTIPSSGDKIITKRAYRILDYLKAGHIDEFVAPETLVRDLNKLGGDAVDYQSYRKAAFLLKCSLCPHGYDIHVSTKHGFKLEQVKQTRYMQRSGEHLEVKLGLGYILWSWLLNIRPEEELEFQYKATHQSRMVAKMAGLRQRIVLSIIADAGSSVTNAIRALLDIETVPIRPKLSGPRGDEEDEREQQCRFVTPHIITNALSIAAMVANSKHADAIGLTLVGGGFHPDLSSICGSMTNQCLDSWGGSGTWKSDIAIIGTTGCWAHPLGTVGFACDDLEEAKLKARWLEMAYFRVVIMDSSKMDAPPSGNIFAPLSSTAIDLLVIDDGKSSGAEEKVANMRREADKGGVAVLTLKTEAS